MLSEYIGRGMRTVEEWERTVEEGPETVLADKLLEQLVRINHTIASTPAMDIDEIALKSDYIKLMTLGARLPEIGEMEWRLIDSMMDDVARLASECGSKRGQAHSN